MVMILYSAWTVCRYENRGGSARGCARQRCVKNTRSLLPRASNVCARLERASSACSLKASSLLNRLALALLVDPPSAPSRTGSGTVRRGPVRSSPVRSGAVRCGPVRSGSVRYDSVRKVSGQLSKVFPVNKYLRAVLYHTPSVP